MNHVFQDHAEGLGGHLRSGQRPEWEWIGHAGWWDLIGVRADMHRSRERKWSLKET